MRLPSVIQDIDWTLDDAKLRSPSFLGIWGRERIPLSAVTDAKTLRRVEAFSQRIIQVGRGFDGPFPLLLPTGWLLARWVAEQQGATRFRLSWLDLENLPLSWTSATPDLRRMQTMQKLKELPTLTQAQQNFLVAAMLHSEKLEVALANVLKENSILEFRLLTELAHPRFGPEASPPSLAQALLFWGTARVAEVLQSLVLAQAVPPGTRLADTVRCSRFLLTSFLPAAQRTPRPAYLVFWFNSLAVSEALLTHYGSPEREALLRRLEHSISDVLAIQRFLYGAHALDVAEMLLGNWGLDWHPLAPEEKTWLGSALDLLPWLRQLAKDQETLPEAWGRLGLLTLQNADHPLWESMPPLDQDRLRAFLELC